MKQVKLGSYEHLYSPTHIEDQAKLNRKHEVKHREYLETLAWQKQQQILEVVSKTQQGKYTRKQ